MYTLFPCYSSLAYTQKMRNDIQVAYIENKRNEVQFKLSIKLLTLTNKSNISRTRYEVKFITYTQYKLKNIHLKG